MGRASEKYLRRVKRRLYASAQTKERLIAGLASEIAEAGDVSCDELVNSFGAPEQAAEELQESVNEAEAASARSKSKRIAIALGVVAAVLVVTLAAYVWYVSNNTNYYFAKEIIETTVLIQ